MEDELKTKWQPILLMMDKRLECDCGSLAVILVMDTLQEQKDGYRKLAYGAYCQPCWQNMERRDG